MKNKTIIVCSLIVFTIGLCGSDFTEIVPQGECKETRLSFSKSRRSNSLDGILKARETKTVEELIITGDAAQLAQFLLDQKIKDKPEDLMQLAEFVKKPELIPIIQDWKNKQSATGLIHRYLGGQQSKYRYDEIDLNSFNPASVKAKPTKVKTSNSTGGIRSPMSSFNSFTTLSAKGRVSPYIPSRDELDSMLAHDGQDSFHEQDEQGSGNTI